MCNVALQVILANCIKLPLVRLILLKLCGTNCLHFYLLNWFSYMSNIYKWKTERKYGLLLHFKFQFGIDDYSEMWVYGFIVLLHKSRLMLLTKVVSIPLMRILDFDDDDGDSAFAKVSSPWIFTTLFRFAFG